MLRLNVLSQQHADSSEAKDHASTKFREYAQAGIPEYWIIQPATHGVSVYTLEGRAYPLLAHFVPGEQARSALLPGFAVAVNDLFQAQQPFVSVLIFESFTSMLSHRQPADSSSAPK